MGKPLPKEYNARPRVRTHDGAEYQAFEEGDLEVPLNRIHAGEIKVDRIYLQPADGGSTLQVAAGVLDRARALFEVDRMKDYGDPTENFKRIATMWSAYKGVEFTPGDVAVLMTIVKLSRLAQDHQKLDSWDDAVAYMALGAEVSRDN